MTNSSKYLIEFGYEENYKYPGGIITLATLAETAAAGPKVAPDGSLVLESDKKSRQGKGAQGDTLYDLLGQEVQVYIFNTKTRVFPTAYLKSSYFRSGSSSWRTCHTPQVAGPDQ